MKNIIIKTIPVFLIATALFAAIPAKVHAFDPIQIVDPFCLWSGCGDDDSSSSVVNNTTTNTNSNNNVNSNVNSTNSSVGANTTNGTTGTPVIVTTPVVTPIYTYNNGGSYNYNYSQLGISCYPTPTYASYGETVIWHASAYGGSGSYYFSWTGTDGLSGNGQNISKAYYTSGYKNASVVVTSGGQTMSANCDNGVNVTGNNYYDYNNNYNYTNNSNYYNGYNNNYYAPLSVTCSANASFAPVGTAVTWSAYVTGGNGSYYSYQWSGTDGVNNGSTNSTVVVNYTSPGVKTMRLNVYSGSQTIVRDCTGTVTVGVPNSYGYGYNNYNNNNVNNNGNLVIACFADATTVRPGVPVTWAVEATGGYANGYNSNYAYAWTGSDGFSGTQSSVVTSYTSPGTKSATVTVTSGGISASKPCGNTVRVAYPAAPAGDNDGTATVSKVNTSANTFSAASLFSLGNIPWGWVAILIILVLFAMVIYLLYNRNEIK